MTSFDVQPLGNSQQTFTDNTQPLEPISGEAGNLFLTQASSSGPKSWENLDEASTEAHLLVPDDGSPIQLTAEQVPPVDPIVVEGIALEAPPGSVSFGPMRIVDLPPNISTGVDTSITQPLDSTNLSMKHKIRTVGLSSAMGGEADQDPQAGIISTSLNFSGRHPVGAGSTVHTNVEIGLGPRLSASIPGDGQNMTVGGSVSLALPTGTRLGVRATSTTPIVSSAGTNNTVDNSIHLSVSQTVQVGDLDVKLGYSQRERDRTRESATGEISHRDTASQTFSLTVSPDSWPVNLGLIFTTTQDHTDSGRGSAHGMLFGLTVRDDDGDWAAGARVDLDNSGVREEERSSVVFGFQTNF